MRKKNVLEQWQALQRLPFGRWLFSKLMGITVPYAASIDARVEVLSAGRAQLRLDDRRAVRNHFKSIHAAALTHLAEMTANLALMTRQPANSRWIVTGMETRFVKIARGAIKAQATLPDVDWSRPQEFEGVVTLRDKHNDVVMTALQRWKTGPARAAG